MAALHEVALALHGRPRQTSASTPKRTEPSLVLVRPPCSTSDSGRMTVPLSPPLLLEVLQAASAQSQDLVQQASTQLKEWEKQAGFWTLLQDAFLDSSLPFELRFIAIITLKQGVDKYWRKTANNAITKSEKQHIRSRLLPSSIDEPNPQLAIQNAVIVGKVARLEYPIEWPKVFTDITGIIREASEATAGEAYDERASLRLTRSLSILLHVVKELAAGRLTRTKSHLQLIAPEVLKVLGGVYVRHAQIWGSLLKQQPIPERAVSTMTISYLAIKIMRRLIVAGYEFPNRAEEVKEAWSILKEHQWAFIATDDEISAPEEVSKLLKKHVLNIGKLYVDVNSSHPAAFTLLPCTLDILGRYWEVAEAYGDVLAAQSKKTVDGITTQATSRLKEDDDKRNAFREKVALQGLILWRGCLKMIYNPTATFKYRHKEEKEEIKISTELLKSKMFSESVVSHCMEVLVTRFFILRPSDLEGWIEDPEGWNEQWENAVDSWEFLLRPCAEKLFSDLIVNHRDVLAGPLLGVLNTMRSKGSDDILAKDAIYTAIGIAAGVLHPHFNFDEFIHDTLVNEIQVSRPGYNIIRRRVAILIGQWVSIKISVENRPTLYKIMQHLLIREDPMNDLVVRLTAAHNLRRCIDEWDFRVDAFLPHVNDLFNRLMGLMDEVEQTETRMGLLYVIGVIVDRLEHRVSQYADRIVQILPALWEQTGEEHLFKQAILSILSKLVSAMKDQSVKYHHMVIPLIRFSVEPGSGMQVYLLEDALELWEATVRATPSPASQEFLELFPYLLSCLELGTVTLRRVLDIIESYVLLAPREIIETYHAQMFAAFAALLGTLKPEGTGIVTHIVELLIRAAKEMGGEQAVNFLGAELVRSEFLVKLFAELRESHSANQTTGPNRKYPPSPLIITDYFSVLARMIVASVPSFMEVVTRVSERMGSMTEQTMEWLLDEWFSHFGNIGHPKQRKLNCLALTLLLETNQGWILRRLQDLMTVWTDVINELTEDGQGDDVLIYWKGDESGEPESPERLRRNELTHSDPVHSINVAHFIKHQLQKAESENGGPEAFQNSWVSNIDAEVVKDFTKVTR